MKNKFLLHATLLCGMIITGGVAHAETVTRLVVWDTDGNKVAYDLKETPSVKFIDDELSITTGQLTDIRVPISQVSRFTYETGSTSDVDNIIGDNANAEFSDGNLVFTLTEGDNTIEIANVQGQVILSTTLRGNGERIYPLTGLQPGVYIVKFNGLTYKIMKQ